MSLEPFFRNARIVGRRRRILAAGLTAITLFGAAGLIFATHFRYGHYFWQPAFSNRVNFTLQNAFRRDGYTCIDPITGGNVSCTGSDGLPGSGDYISETIGGTTFAFGDGLSTPRLNYQVTSIDTASNFLFAVALNPGTASPIVPHTYTAAGNFTAFTNSTARISASGGHINNPDGGYRVETIVNAPAPLAACAGAITFLSENFDSVTPPALPAGWTSGGTGAAPFWVTSNSGLPAPAADSPPNSAFVTGSAAASDKRLNSPPTLISSTQARLSFRNNYDFQFAGPNYFDGGVLEISYDGTNFSDIVTAGGSFVAGGYTATLNAGSGNPLAGRMAWTGNSGGFLTTVVMLPANASGRTVTLRWRMGSDNSIASNGWRIDNVLLNNCSAPDPGNRSPVSSLPPIITCTQDSVCSFDVPASDPDGDPLTYRFSTATEASSTAPASACPSTFCQPGPPFAPNAATINPTTGRYTWNTTGATLASGTNPTLYSTQVTIEDHNGSVTGAIKSKVALDFLIRLVPNVVGTPPQFNSPVCQSTLTTMVGSALTFTIQASDVDAGDLVTLTVAGLPPGATMTPPLPASGNPVSSTFNWTPTTTGTFVISFTATDSTLRQTLCSVTVNVQAMPTPTPSPSPTPAPGCPAGACCVCHKLTQTLPLVCGSLEYRRHLDHGDTIGPCQ